jgi:hypothetical protein
MDIEDRDTLIKLLDKAMCSKELAVKDLLQSLLVTTALVHADDKKVCGPLYDMITNMHAMQATMCDMSNSIDSLNNKIRKLESMLLMPAVKDYIDTDYKSKYVWPHKINNDYKLW